MEIMVAWKSITMLRLFSASNPSIFLVLSVHSKYSQILHKILFWQCFQAVDISYGDPQSFHFEVLSSLFKWPWMCFSKFHWYVKSWRTIWPKVHLLAMHLQNRLNLTHLSNIIHFRFCTESINQEPSDFEENLAKFLGRHKTGLLWCDVQR